MVFPLQKWLLGKMLQQTIIILNFGIRAFVPIQMVLQALSHREDVFLAGRVNHMVPRALGVGDIVRGGNGDRKAAIARPTVNRGKADGQSCFFVNFASQFDSVDMHGLFSFEQVFVKVACVFVTLKPFFHLRQVVGYAWFILLFKGIRLLLR
jgi:hypothetical protein